ncbi:MAG: hypothetical protein PHD49_00190 [Candidatus Shapirobacteria bacterium]|nr:hypothetical protein [Candidatus Shapirobacteria bacterium]
MISPNQTLKIEKYFQTTYCQKLTHQEIEEITQSLKYLGKAIVRFHLLNEKEGHKKR